MNVKLGRISAATLSFVFLVLSKKICSFKTFKDATPSIYITMRLDLFSFGENRINLGKPSSFSMSNEVLS